MRPRGTKIVPSVSFFLRQPGDELSSLTVIPSSTRHIPTEKTPTDPSRFHYRNVQNNLQPVGRGISLPVPSERQAP